VVLTFRHLAIIGGLLALGACGGGGGGYSGGVSSTPTPTPTPTNTSITNLVANQNFANNDASSTLTFDLSTDTTTTGTAKLAPLTVTYDATSKSYTLSGVNGPETFAAADLVSSAGGEAKYRKGTGNDRDYLTLVTTPYTGSTSNKYVGLGYWQRNTITGSTQNTFFDVFTYGLATPATATPRTGSAAFAVDVFGVEAIPGIEPRVFQGRGAFNVDFGSSVFSTDTYLTETGLLTGQGVSGGGLELKAAGTLTSGTSLFSGNFVYGGQNGSISGQLSGGFYGPAADELGASFAGSNSAGASVTGGLTGQRDTTLPAANLTLLNMTSPQLFYTQEAVLDYTSFDGDSAAPYARTTTMVSQLNHLDNNTFSYAPGRSDLPGGTFTATSVVPSSDPNFTRYQKSFNGQDVTLELYRPGSANTELALTYASFGRWHSSAKQGVVTTDSTDYFVYGLATPAGLLSAKKGTAHYAGIAYGAGANETTGARYDVRGTSIFDVNFTDQSYSGALALHATNATSSQAVDFGTFSFANPLSATTAASQAMLMQNGINVGGLTTNFYGPNGEEIGGPFTVNVADPTGSGRAAIAGITLAKTP